MGLLKAGAGALGGVLADSWRDYFYCESLDADVLVAKGEKRVGNRSSNKKARKISFPMVQLSMSTTDNA